jgi:hypothetical protein
MRGWLRLGVVALCVALTPTAAYARAPSSVADQFGAAVGFNPDTGQMSHPELSVTTRKSAAIQRESIQPIDLLSLLVTVVAVSALLATGVALHYAGARHRYERQELVGDEDAAVPMLLEPADRPVDVALLDGIQRHTHHACDEGGAPLVRVRWSSPTRFGGLTVPQRGQTARRTKRGYL